MIEDRYTRAFRTVSLPANPFLSKASGTDFLRSHNIMLICNYCQLEWSKTIIWVTTSSETAYNNSPQSRGPREGAIGLLHGIKNNKGLTGTDHLPKLGLMTPTPLLNSGVFGLRTGPYVPSPKFLTKSLATERERLSKIRFLT